jgi:predicted nucleotidyltransferase
MRLSFRSVEFLVSVISRHFGQVDVWLFGSRVLGNLKGGDIDLAIKCGLSANEFRQKRLKVLTDLALSDFAYPVDLVRYSFDMDELLKSEIDNNHVDLSEVLHHEVGRKK